MEATLQSSRCNSSFHRAAFCQDRGRNDVDSQAQEIIMERQRGRAIEQLEVLKNQLEMVEQTVLEISTAVVLAAIHSCISLGYYPAGWCNA